MIGVNTTQNPNHNPQNSLFELKSRIGGISGPKKIRVRYSAPFSIVNIIPYDHHNITLVILTITAFNASALLSRLTESEYHIQYIKTWLSTLETVNLS